MEAIVGYKESTVSPSNVFVKPVGTKTKLNYYQSVYRATDRRLQNGDFDIYHHMNFGYRWFNPLVLLDRINDRPFIVGPAQAGHDILAEEFNGMVNKSVGFEVPRILTDPLHWTFEQCRDVVVDPTRLRLMEKTLRQANRVIVVHEDAKAIYEKYVDKSKIKIVPLGVDPADFPFHERSDNHDLVAVGSLTERKGYNDLLDALSQIQQSVPDVHLDIFGDGPLKNKLKQQAEHLDISDAVRFHGWVDQSKVREHFQSARAFVHPSLSESFSLVRLEAMSSGCPVVVSNTSGAEEMVRDGVDGFVVPRRSPTVLAEAVTRVLSDYELAVEMGHNARIRIENRYAWSKIADEYLNIYHDVLG